MNWLFGAIAAVWGVATIYLLLQVITLCYRIEKRSRPDAGAQNSAPQRANIIAAAFNFGVARDSETQAMRRQMNFYLLIIMTGFIAMGLMVSIWARMAGG